MPQPSTLDDTERDITPGPDLTPDVTPGDGTPNVPNVPDTPNVPDVGPDGGGTPVTPNVPNVPDTPSPGGTPSPGVPGGGGGTPGEDAAGGVRRPSWWRRALAATLRGIARTNQEGAVRDLAPRRFGGGGRGGDIIPG